MKKDQVSDHPIKVQAMGLLWGQGYVVRPEVVLSHSRVQRSTRSQDAYLDLTDIDVMGYQFDGLLVANTIAVDCGAGTRRAVMERVFWCKGLRDALSLSRIICVVGRETEEEHRIAAHAMDVILMSASRFEEISKLSSVPAAPTIFETYYARNLEWLSLLGNASSGLSTYILKDNWSREWDRMPVQLPAQLKNWKVNLDISKPVHRFGILELAILLSISLVKLASTMLLVAPSDLTGSVQGFVLGGLKRYKLIESLMRRAEQLAAKGNGQQQLDLPEGVNSVGPLSIPYISDLLDIVHRFNLRPVAASQVPRYLQAFQLAQLGGDISKYEFYLGRQADPFSSKLAIDVVRYLGVAGECRMQLMPLFDAV